MIDQLVSFDTVRLAKEKGFPKDLVIIDHVTEVGSFVESPTQSLLQKWLREKHKLEVYAYSNASGFHYGICKSFHPSWFSGGTHIKDSDLSGPNGAGGWNTYEEALEQGLITALNML